MERLKLIAWGVVDGVGVASIVILSALALVVFYLRREERQERSDPAQARQPSPVVLTLPLSAYDRALLESAIEKVVPPSLEERQRLRTLARALMRDNDTLRRKLDGARESLLYLRDAAAALGIEENEFENTTHKTESEMPS